MSITIEQMNEHVRLIADLRAKEAEISQHKKAVSEELELAEQKALSMLEESGMKSFKTPFGTVGVSYRTSVRTPKTEEDKQKLFVYLRERGLESMIGVNSMSLNSLYKAGLEQAIAEGKDDFELPGVTEVTMNPIISFRKA
jgi:hypothetical protein